MSFSLSPCMSPAQCCTPTSSDETLALLSLPVSQLRAFASLSPHQQQQLLQLSAKSSKTAAVAPLRSATNKLTVTAKRRSDESASILRSAKLELKSASLRNGGRAMVSHTAPTSPRVDSAGTSGSRTPSQPNSGLPPLAPSTLRPSVTKAATYLPTYSSQPSDTAWGATYSFQPTTDSHNDGSSTAASAEADEPDASSSFIPSSLTYTDAKIAPDMEAADEEADIVAPTISYISRLSLDTRTPPSTSAPSSQTPTPRNDNKFGLKLRLGADDADNDSGGTPTAASSLFTPQNDNKFGLKLNFGALAADSPSHAFSPASTLSIIPTSAGCSAAAGDESSSVVPLPFVAELRDAAQTRKHRKGQMSYELTECGTLLAGGYQINSKGVMHTPGLRPSVSGAQAVNLLNGVPPLIAAEGADFRSSISSPSFGHGAALTTSIPSTSTSPSNQSPNSSVLLGESLQLCDLVRLSELGAGASGTVVKALHLPTLRLLALKTVSVFSQTDRHQLVKELNGFCTASGPNILQFVGACFSEGSCVMALELMNRGSLEGLVQRHGPVKNERFLRAMVRQVLLGLSQLAKLHCVHRDIKLANLLMNDTGVCKISDFGLMRQLDGTQDMCNTFLGTMAFLSPERITGDAYTSKSDVWSTGISVVYLVKGKLSMPTEYWSLLSIVNSAAPSLTTADGASELLCDFVRCCLQKDPADRWSAEQLLAHPWMTSDELPSAGGDAGWPVHDSIAPDAAEMDKIVDAVIAHHYKDAPYTGAAEDVERAAQLARQLGCDESLVDEAFLARFAPTPNTASPALAAAISYQPPSALHSRKPSSSVLTMAEEREHEEAGNSDAEAVAAGRRVKGLSATLGSALSMSQLIRQKMQQAAEDDGYDGDSTSASPLSGSVAEPNLLMSLRSAIATGMVAEEPEAEEEEDDQASSCITYV